MDEGAISEWETVDTLKPPEPPERLKPPEPPEPCMRLYVLAGAAAAVLAVYLCRPRS